MKDMVKKGLGALGSHSKVFNEGFKEVCRQAGAVQCVPCSTDRSTQYPGASSQVQHPRIRLLVPLSPLWVVRAPEGHSRTCSACQTCRRMPSPA
eukprot:6365749-Amphidinium_carterae.4